MAALQFVDVPGYAAILFRRTFSDLALPGALMDRAGEWLRGTAARWHGIEKRWSFPSGATLSFGYLDTENDKYRYQSADFQYVGFDEASQFTESQYRYLFSRLRRLNTSDVPTRMRAASNPGGVGHEWVKKRFIGKDTHYQASLKDNPHIDAAEYRQNLANLDPITRQQLEHGDWDAYAGGRFKRDWLRKYIVKGPYLHFGDKAYTPLQLTGRFLTVDPAATAKELAKDDPDFTSISAWATTPCGKLVWLGCKLVRCEIPDIPPLVAEMYARHKAAMALVEGIGVGKGAAQLCKRHPAHMNVVEVKSVKDKLTNAANALNMAEAWRVWLPADDPTFPLEEIEAQLIRFTGDPGRDGHDDAVDNLSTAANRVTVRAVADKPTPIAGALRPGF